MIRMVNTEVWGDSSAVKNIRLFSTDNNDAKALVIWRDGSQWEYDLDAEGVSKVYTEVPTLLQSSMGRLANVIKKAAGKNAHGRPAGHGNVI